MGGAGAFAAGLEPAGLDPVAAPSTLDVLGDQGAPTYFLQDKGFRLLPDGTFVTADDVDQAVELALGIGVGTIGSATEIGNKMRQRGRMAPEQVESAVKDDVAQALSDLIKSGLVIVTDVAVQEQSRGQRIVAVSYWNTRRQGTAPTTVKSAL